MPRAKFVIIFIVLSVALFSTYYFVSHILRASDILLSMQHVIYQEIATLEWIEEFDWILIFRTCKQNPLHKPKPQL